MSKSMADKAKTAAAYFAARRRLGPFEVCLVHNSGSIGRTLSMKITAAWV